MAGIWQNEFVKEAKKQLVLALPLILVGVLQYSTQAVSLIFVGHLSDDVALSGASMATSFASVAAFSLLV